jgi:hypothetical protein
LTLAPSCSLVASRRVAPRRAAQAFIISMVVSVPLVPHTFALCVVPFTLVTIALRGAKLCAPRGRGAARGGQERAAGMEGSAR